MEFLVNPLLEPWQMLAERGSACDSVDGAEDRDDPVVFRGSEFVAAEFAVFRRIPLRNERGGERIVALRVFADFAR